MVLKKITIWILLTFIMFLTTGVSLFSAEKKSIPYVHILRNLFLSSEVKKEIKNYCSTVMYSDEVVATRNKLRQDYKAFPPGSSDYMEAREKYSSYSRLIFKNYLEKLQSLLTEMEYNDFMKAYKEELEEKRKKAELEKARLEESKPATPVSSEVQVQPLTSEGEAIVIINKKVFKVSQKTKKKFFILNFITQQTMWILVILFFLVLMMIILKVFLVLREVEEV